MVFLVILAGPLHGQDPDYSVLRINEVIAENSSRGPMDVGGAFVDMVEILNTGAVPLQLGFASRNQSIALTDTLELPLDTVPWTFRNLTEVQPGESLIVFCDGNLSQDLCEPHASFSIANDGSEPITLWGPVIGMDGTKPIRAILDQVWLPPLRADVSFGRFPDGAGPAPVPREETLETFVFNPPGMSTFGFCLDIGPACDGKTKRRFCRGAANASGGNLEPRINLEVYSTNSPAPLEAVQLTARVDDDKEPTEPNIAAVEIVYRVDGGPESVLPLVYDAASGIQHGVIRDANGDVIGENPLDRWTLWDGEIPGQPVGSRVEFFLRVRDAGGAGDQSPAVLCEPGTGPCEREFGGPNCPRDAGDVTCSNPSFMGERYVSCRTRFTYKVGHVVRTDLAGLVINEVVSTQDGLVEDPSEGPCEDADNCPPTKLNCCRFRDDFIELYNGSSAAVDLSGLWLSDGPFNPQVWQFPAGSSIPAGEYRIVWLDGDGGKCPDPGRPTSTRPCFWECPDPTNPASGAWHTNFALNREEDEVYLFDTEANGFGVVHGAEFRDQVLNHSLALVPNGDRSGCWIDAATPTPGAANVGACSGGFQRGDSNASCGLDIGDAIFTLGYLFTGGPAPPCPDAADSNDDGTLNLSDPVSALGFLFLGLTPPPTPGPFTPGADPTADDLAECIAPSC